MKDLLKNVVHSFGYDLSRTSRPGFDPFADLHTLIAEPAVIFDVGANVGQSARKFRPLFPDAVIHSFEPGAQAFAQLQQELKADPKSRAWNFGLGETRQRRTFFENRETVLSSFLPSGKDSWQDGGSPIECELSTVDSFCESAAIGRIDILKSDTQGYDLNVFKGASRMMKEAKIGAILTELNFTEIYAGQGSVGQIFELLNGFDFRLFCFYPEVRMDGWPAWTDALFAHRSLQRPLARTSP
jgi:FkbM family methyltransferase